VSPYLFAAFEFRVASIYPVNFELAHIHHWFVDIVFGSTIHSNMASPAAKLLRLWRYNTFARGLTLAVLGICAALLYGLGTPIKSVLCNADLPKAQIAQIAFNFTSFQTAQSLICSEKDFIPKWNLSYHQGGNGPWVPKVDGVINDELALPDGCVIDQVHMVSSGNASQGADSCVEAPAGGCLTTKSSCHIGGLECNNADFE
jgi:hypothetical protein